MKQTEVFDGENFPDWKFKLRNNILTYGGQEILNALDAASTETKEILESSYSPSVKDDYISWSKFIYAILATKLKGDPLTITKNVSTMNGLEAWRKLHLRYDARTIGKRVTLIRRMVSPQKIKQVKDVPKSMENLGGNIQIFEKRI